LAGDWNIQDFVYSNNETFLTVLFCKQWNAIKNEKAAIAYPEIPLFLGID
jgi:hypothetical protein